MVGKRLKTPLHSFLCSVERVLYAVKRATLAGGWGENPSVEDFVLGAQFLQWFRGGFMGGREFFSVEY